MWKRRREKQENVLRRKIFGQQRRQNGKVGNIWLGEEEKNRDGKGGKHLKEGEIAAKGWDGRKEM